MFKLFYVIFMNLFRAPYMIPKMRYLANHPEKYIDEKDWKNLYQDVRGGKSTQRRRIYYVSQPPGKV